MTLKPLSHKPLPSPSPNPNTHTLPCSPVPHPSVGHVHNGMKTNNLLCFKWRNYTVTSINLVTRYESLENAFFVLFLNWHGKQRNNKNNQLQIFKFPPSLHDYQLVMTSGQMEVLYPGRAVFSLGFLKWGPWDPLVNRNRKAQPNKSLGRNGKLDIKMYNFGGQGKLSNVFWCGCQNLFYVSFIEIPLYILMITLENWHTRPVNNLFLLQFLESAFLWPVLTVH